MLIEDFSREINSSNFLCNIDYGRIIGVCLELLEVKIIVKNSLAFILLEADKYIYSMSSFILGKKQFPIVQKHWQKNQVI